jgi:hypothetical protein
MAESAGKYARISEWICGKLKKKTFPRENLIRFLNLQKYESYECRQFREMLEKLDKEPKTSEEINRLINNENIYNALQDFQTDYKKDTSIKKQSTKKISIGTKSIGKSKRVTLLK